MTRFTRAQGSKASNIREPEESTPWHIIKLQLEEKKHDKFEDNTEGYSYKNYLEDNSEEPPTKWVDFSDEESGAQEKKVDIKNHRNKINNKHKKLINIDAQIEKSEALEWDSSKKLFQNKKQMAKLTIQQGNTTKLEYVENNSKEDVKRSKKHKYQAGKEEGQETEQPGTENISSRKKTKKNKEIKAENKVVEEEIVSISKIESKNNRLYKNNENGLKKKQNKLRKSDKKEENKKMFHGKKLKQNERNDKFENKRTFKNGKEKNRRKPRLEECVIGGKNVMLMYIDGFPVKKEDGEKLIQLRKDLISKGVPRSEIEKAMKLERRRAEKALAREKKKLCFNCRRSGHVLSECPNISMDMTETTATGICFKCGSTEHTHFECRVVKNDSYKFAQCFICKEQGHISRQCPDNPKGLYPQGGGCNICGDVTHLKKDCPAYVTQQQENKLVVNTINDGNIENIGHNFNLKNTKNIKKQKIVKF